MSTDYYEVLGVDQTATQDEIRKAYRRMSRKYHPDIAGPEFEDKFKDVNNAYAVLSDPEKRRMYDQGVDPNDPNAAAGFGTARGFGDFGDIFSQFFTGGFSQGRSASPVPRQQKGRDSLTKMTISLKDAVFGCQRNIQIQTYGLCQACKGSGSADGSAPVLCPICHGAGYRQEVQRTLLGQMMTTVPCERCEGYGTIIEKPCQQCQGHGRVRTQRTVSISVPAGVSDGMRVRLASQGEVGEGGGPAGDLYVDIAVKPDKDFSRQGDDLHCWIRIPMTWAALGHQLPLQTFDGERQLDIPQGSQPDDVLTMKGLGATRINSKDRGDLLVHLQVEIPRNLTQQQRDALESFAQSHDAAAEAVNQQSQPIKAKRSFFDRIKEALN
ncbi:MAG: molecular chaperone DnaJ [Aeriscardovia sp.]|nr:molecular chaperone DnaJ [Aeriscardovia sp.]MBQ9681530.1 molecular chaperone DnaJ [Aeriscardovia sp.]